jgi:hypothetical protein
MCSAAPEYCGASGRSMVASSRPTTDSVHTWGQRGNRKPSIRSGRGLQTPTHSGAFGGPAAVSLGRDCRPVALRRRLSTGLPLSELVRLSLTQHESAAEGRSDGRRWRFPKNISGVPKGKRDNRSATPARWTSHYDESIERTYDQEVRRCGESYGWSGRWSG